MTELLWILVLSWAFGTLAAICRLDEGASEAIDWVRKSVRSFLRRPPTL